MITKNKIQARRAFTLIELLVVISIIGVLATFTIVSVQAIAKNRKISTARGELIQIESALEDYKAKYGTYPPGNNGNYAAPVYGSMLNQLYYELSGTTSSGGNFVTLDGSAQLNSSTIKVADVSTAFKVGGFVNCTKGSGEEAATAKSFLPGLRPNQYFYPVTNNGIPTTILVTSVGGPDDTYKPLSAVGINPIRYQYPGTNNPNSYDLWVQLQISGKKYLVSNWSKSALVNTTYP